MGAPKAKHRILNDKELFYRYYVEGGPGYSFNKLEKWVNSTYGNNRYTGRPITGGAVWQAPQRYLVRNFDDPEVKQIYMKFYIDCGLDPLTEDEYLEIISQRAKTIFADTQYKHFCEEHPELPYLED